MVPVVQTLVLGSERFDCLPRLLNRDPGDTHVVYVSSDTRWKAPNLATTKATGRRPRAPVERHSRRGSCLSTECQTLALYL